MSLEQKTEQRQPLHKALRRRVLNALKSNWKLKLLSLAVAITIWGALISEDATLTREKTFQDVPVSVTGVDTLQRNGLVVIQGLDNIAPIRMRAEVPQKVYESATPASYAVRVDVSRINAVGDQTVPILTSSSAAYGSVEWLSTTDIAVKVDEYITRRRVPVRLSLTGQVPEGYYSAGVSPDPAAAVISGPRSQVERVSYISAVFDQGSPGTASGVQYSAVPFKLIASDGSEINSRHISVTSENVLLDTILVEQTVYPMKAVDINLTGLVRGEVMEGYQITGIKADPPQVRLAGSLQDIAGIRLMDLSSGIDVTGMSETVIRALRVEKPAGVAYMSDTAVYVTVEIQPALKTGDP